MVLAAGTLNRYEYQQKIFFIAALNSLPKKLYF